jgi:hypothetical protein
MPVTNFLCVDSTNEKRRVVLAELDPVTNQYPLMTCVACEQNERSISSIFAALKESISA